MFWTYVIRSDEGHRYIGQTGDLEQRLQDHNSGRNHATKHGHNWVLIHSEMLSTRSEAMRREKWL
ncbi:MAG: GIY-YIG nuclease family protein, partial [Bacteroidota bacterium]